MIDEYCISVIPTILGGGIPLFGDGEREIKLRLKCTETYNGITELSKTFDRQIHAFVIKIYMQGDRKWNWENRSENSESISGNRGRSDCSGSIFILSLDSGCKAILES